MSLTQRQTRARGIALARGRAWRQSEARERVAIMPIMFRVSSGLGVYFSEPVPYFQCNNPMFRSYLKHSGIDEHVGFSLDLEHYTVGVPEITLPILGTESPTLLANVFPASLDGTPTITEVAAGKVRTLTGKTHIRIKMDVTSWNVRYDMPVIVELWCNAWRRRRNAFIGITALDSGAQQNLNQEGLDINNNLLTSRETLR